MILVGSSLGGMASRLSQTLSGSGTSQYESGMDKTVLKDRLRCLSRLYSSQNTLLRSSRRSNSTNVASERSLWQEHKGFAQGETDAGHRSSSRFNWRERVSLTAFDHHL
ncbi:hypothetical protein VFPPC_17909 [Pochonia chlamydosporia 170]|uniref:Uncharacterized protein n=1 Tax=Pochonia chlamydosporia 170 TaxID=1380566 RepID=A0A219AQ13_METCM|nr:hypothetical protein VFPPC_17909 [Pochonia chlamydosporia 170]OWT42898.1 hypothetical protein VFPPC_17909 [Pochonia chlamydosporia 170]